MFSLLLWASLAHAEEDAETVSSSGAASESTETTATNSPQEDDVETRLRVLEREVLRLEAELVVAQQTPPVPVQNHPPNGFNPSLTAFGDLHTTAGFHDGEVMTGSGPWLRSLELDVRSAVDPFADAVAVIAIEQGPPIDLGPSDDHEGHDHEDEGEQDAHAGHDEVEVHAEEVYVDFVALPKGLSARVGAFLQPFGVTNRSHPHDWPWPDTPLAIAEAFGDHGFRDVGAVLSWRTGLADSVALSLQGGALSGALGDEDSTGPGWIGRAEAFAEWGQSLDWELALGEDALAEATDDDGTERPFDNYAARRDWEDSQDDDEEDEESTEPFEKVKLRVSYPKFSDYPQELVLERWIRWEQVYGPSEEDLLAEEQAGEAGTGAGAPAGGQNSLDGGGR